MSVPPLVCSTPPPPDQVDDEEYNDEFVFSSYEDGSFSPTHQYNTTEYQSYSPSFSNERESTIASTVTPATSVHYNTVSTKDAIVRDSDEIINDGSRQNTKADTKTDLNQNEDTNSLSEECNVEDLDLKLESIQIDYDTDRVSVEESLNSTYDDFGTFLSSNELDGSRFISSPSEPDQGSESEKDSKSHETYSDDSVSLQNDDARDFGTGWLSSYGTETKNDNADIEVNSVTNQVPQSDSLNDLDKINTEDFSNSLQSTNFEVASNEAGDPKEKHFDSSITDINLNSLICNENIHTKNGAEDILDELKHSDKDFEDTDKVNVVLDVREILSPVSPLDDDEFGDFTEATNNFPDTLCSRLDSESKPSIDEVTGAIDVLASTDNDEFDDFATFQHANSDKVTRLVIEKESQDFQCEEDVKFEAFAEGEISDQLGNVDSFVKDNAGNVSLTTEEDDFGDFDTYNPVCEESETNITVSNVSSSKPADSYKVDDLVDSDDSELIEILRKAVNLIYLEENLTSNEDLESNHSELMVVLGECWKHLKDYELEQSYLFTWNNSTSHKSLLKSLGIDSRNILFGPKWNSNMPRFAANLGASPLQPIKQTLMPTSSADLRHDDKSDISPNSSQPSASDWQGIDNYSMVDNQASSYAESLLLDLEHLMATLDQMTSGQSAHFKISDLFTNACSERGEEHNLKTLPSANEFGNKPDVIHPPSILNIGRKINLPDTHIFTPTDSKTPWSQTIHYDDTGTNLSTNIKSSAFEQVFPIESSKVENKPNTIANECDDFDDFKSHENFEFSQPKQESIIKSADEFETFEKDCSIETQHENLTDPQDSVTPPFPVMLNSPEFDDFGDFHSAAALESIVSQTTEITKPTKVLQPVRLSPSVPVLNWPAPGDVNSALFDEFSSIPNLQNIQYSWNKEPENVNIPQPQQYPRVFSPTSACFILKETKIDSVSCDTTNADKDFDEFTDFQSVSNVPQEINTNSSINTHKASNEMTESVFSNKVPFNDDFDDFQSVEFNPVLNNSLQMKLSIEKFSTSKMPIMNQQNQYKMENISSTNNYYFSNSSKPTTENQTIEATGQHKNVSQQILQPLSLENYSQIMWPEPGGNLQDFSRFNPVNMIPSYGETKDPPKSVNHHSNDDEGWSDFVSIKPNTQTGSNYFTSQASNYIPASAGFVPDQPNDENDDWSDFVSGTVLPSRCPNEVKTISQNIHSQSGGNTSAPYYNSNQTNANSAYKISQPSNISSNISIIPSLSYVSPRVNVKNTSNNHFQNL